MEGVVADDKDFPKVRNDYEKLVIDNMRDGGFIPVLGMGPYFATDFDKDTGTYNFLITAYGVFVGERKSWKLEGIDLDSGVLYPKSTSRNKSKRS